MKQTFAEKKYKRSKHILLIYLLVLIVILLFSIPYSFLSFNELRFPDVFSVVATVTLFALVAILASIVSEYLDKKTEKVAIDAEKSKRGFEGENIARPVILEAVGQEYKVFFNKDLPGRGDIDCLILGRKGLILVEVKNFEKSVSLYSKMKYDPRTQVIRQSWRLKRYFKDNGFSKNIHIHLVVLYINPDVSFRGKQGVYNIRGTARFKKYFDDLSIDNEISSEDIDRMSLLVESLK